MKMNVLDKFNLTYDELIKGVLCKKCSYTPMIRLRGKWKCNVCGTISIDGHLSAMRDYALLVNEVFTNQLIKNFLLLPSSSIAKYLLTSANLTSTGMKKQRKYRLDLSSFHPECWLDFFHIGIFISRKPGYGLQ
ncbi:hypothetical protein [Pseudalkalibacillus salsuginis]|uniref:hypothetical protein n=1 Tax=Pseudalkalibacillus salsuginis TaxID=2910972 RepID=UPI001F4868E9|nr:hypothetical protein [Pseudalkalibacillus salsuginis]MCF6408373.1 hypothetical protein [Pseudalkalibacillus salsuginis]